MRPNSLFRWTSRYISTSTLLTLLVIFVAAALFIALAREVVEGETRSFDEALLLALRSPGDAHDPIGPGWFQEFMRDITALGGVGVLSLVTAAVLGFLWIQGNRRSLLLTLAAIVSGMMMSSLLKSGFDRPRPDLVPHGQIVYTASFPSGHAMLSAVVYLTLAALVARVQPRMRMKVYIVSIAAFLTVAVGASRVYLGVHWPTDVAAGWAVGAAWAMLWWIIARWLQTQGMADPEQAEPVQLAAPGAVDGPPVPPGTTMPGEDAAIVRAQPSSPPPSSTGAASS